MCKQSQYIGITKTDTEKAELLNKFFKSVFTTEDSGPVPEVPEYDFKESRDDVWITADGVRQLLAGLQPGKAAGPDGLPPRILSVAANELAVPLAHLPPRWPSGKASASRVEGPGFESRLRQDFFGVESYQWLKHWHSSCYPARRLAL